MINDSRKNKQAIMSLIIPAKSDVPDSTDDYVDVHINGEMIDIVKNLDNTSIVGVKGYFVRKKKEDVTMLVAEKVTYLSRTKDIEEE